MTPAPLGQHFLINRNVAQKIIQNLLPARGPILEIGPGRGILTEPMVRQVKPNNLILVEKDKELFEVINQRFGKHCRVIQADILDINLAELAGQENLNLIGNIPYYISSDLTDWIIKQNRYVRRGILMMQREFVQKTIGIPKSKTNNARGVMFRALFQSERIFDVKPGSFSPPPRVMSTVFTFFPRPDPTNIPDETGFYGFLRQAFGSRRKTLFNNIIGQCDKEKTAILFDTLKITKDTRAEQLDLPDFMKLYSGLTHTR